MFPLFCLKLPWGRRQKNKLNKKEVFILSLLIIVHLFWHVALIIPLSQSYLNKSFFFFRFLLQASCHLFENIRSILKEYLSEVMWDYDAVQVWNSSTGSHLPVTIDVLFTYIQLHPHLIKTIYCIYTHIHFSYLNLCNSIVSYFVFRLQVNQMYFSSQI